MCGANELTGLKTECGCHSLIVSVAMTTKVHIELKTH